MAALSGVPLPANVTAAAAPALSSAPFYPAGREPASRERRWSADGWLLMRRGGQARLGAGAAPATYGASQAGAVLRYRLAPESRHRPAAYARVSAALNGSREQEAALGLSARPFPRIPAVAAVELRATSDSHGTRVRPVAMAITELPLLELPLGMRAETYVQAGYAGGKGATAFADGQLRVDHRILRLDRAELRAGGGAWGGGQEGATRLDVGPSATLGLPLGRDVSARMALDWRFRVAGNAAPASGPAFTLSAGF